MELITFIWTNIITQATPSVIAAVEFAIMIAGGWYLREKLNEIKKGTEAMSASIAALDTQLANHQEETSRVYARRSDVDASFLALQRDLTQMREASQRDSANIQGQLTQISAAIITAVSRS